MELPEDKVLEKLNKVSTAKRQAYMVSELRQMIHSDDVDIMLMIGAIRYDVWEEGKHQ